MNVTHAQKTAKDIIAVLTDSINVSKAPIISSAKVCLADAASLFEEGCYISSCHRALVGLSYSIGVFDPTYRIWSKIIG